MRYIELPHEVFKLYDTCNIIIPKYMKGKESGIKISMHYYLPGAYSVKDNEFWTNSLRNAYKIKELCNSCKEYRNSLDIKILRNAEDVLKDIQPFYFFCRAKALIVNQLAYDLSNEFYHEQRRADFAHVRNDADVFAEKMKKIMMPYLEMQYEFGFLNEGDLPDVRKGIDYTNIELEMKNIISNFWHNLTKIDYKSRGYQASPLEKIDLLLKVFEVIAVMQKDGKLGKKSSFNDFLKWNFLKEHNISMPGLDEIKTEYEKLVLKINETVGENQNPETDTYQLCIHSYLELMLLEIYRFFERKPTVAVCSNCKKIFVGESGKRIYCPYPFEGTKTCADMGSNIAKQKEKLR